jgi:putative transposase
VGARQANAYCERLIGTIRRECVDFLIPLNGQHLRRILAEWVPDYNHGRPHAILGPAIPDRPSSAAPRSHRIPPSHRVAATAILGGLDTSIASSRPQRDFCGAQGGVRRGKSA